MAKVGRPTKYYPDLIEEINKYIEESIPENMAFPQVEEFAHKIGVTKKTLYNWGKKHKEFLHALRMLKQKQKIDLVKIGVFGGKEINSNIVSLLLKVNHKMIEKTGIDVTSGGKPILGGSTSKDGLSSNNSDEEDS